MNGKTRFLAMLLGCQGIDEFKALVPAAMNFGVTATEIKELTYQSVAYLGIGRVLPFFRAVNEIFQERGIKLSLESQTTTTMENRLEAGEKAQIDKVCGVFGSPAQEIPSTLTNG